MIYYCQTKLGGLYLHCCFAFVAQPFIFRRSISCFCTVCSKIKTKVMQESIVSYHFPVDMKSIFLCIMNTDKCLYPYCFISFHMHIYRLCVVSKKYVKSMNICKKYGRVCKKCKQIWKKKTLKPPPRNRAHRKD